MDNIDIQNLSKNNLIKSRKSQQAFTIVELLVVIVVIGILAAITIVSYVGISKKAADATLSADLGNASKQLKLFQAEYNKYPDTIDCGSADSSTNKCLRASPNNSFNYSFDNNSSPQTFVLDATNTNGTTYRVTDGTAPGSTTEVTAIAAISGTKAVGSVLTAGASTPVAATVAYQWHIATTSGGTYTNISGATSSTYTPVAGDLGKYIKLEITGTGIYHGVILSAATTVITTPLTAIAAVSGTKAVGSVLTAGALTPAGTASYQWQTATTSGGVYSNIAGATASTYTLVAGDTGDFIKVVATGTGNYTGSVASAATTVITAPLTAIAAITGTTTVGSVLTAGAITPAAATVTYQWQNATTSGGVYTNIAGATASTYTLVVGDQTKFIKVVVTGTGNFTGTVTSAATTVIN